MKSIKDILTACRTDTPTVLDLYRKWDHNQEVGFIRLLKEAVKLKLLDVETLGDRIQDHIVMLTNLGSEILKDTLEDAITNVKEHVSKFGSEDKEP